MLSRRKLFSMLLMMFVLFALFMLTQVYRDIANDYDTNEYASETVVRRANVWTAPTAAQAGEEDTVFIGGESSDMENVISQWCTYTKRSLCRFGSLAEYLAQEDVDAAVLCIEPAYLSLPSDASRLTKLVERDVVIIFGGLPNAREVASSPELCRLLGIEALRSEEIELSGIYLYEGFLLGGEALYRPDEEDGADPLDVTIPWYKLGNQTKVYLTGLVGAAEDDTGQKERPAILWRNTERNAKIFVVNGDYLCDETGLGLLSGMMAESYPYVLYPVVNAQNLTVADYPSFASENDEEVERIYSNSHRMLLQNIVWPSLVSVSAQSGFKMTCLMTPQLLYSENYEPEMDNLVYYLRQLKEQRGEAGWSAGEENGLSAAEKWDRDRAFFQSTGSDYVHTAVYAPGQQADEVLALVESGQAPDIRTMTGICEDTDSLLSFISDNITYQGITHSANSYDFSDDLRNRSLQSALGYTNILLDMKPITWPRSEADRWENYSRQVSGNIGTWWNRFSYFDKTTLTESDTRLRSFLALDYEDRQEGNAIDLTVSNRQGTVSFLLRTHDKRVRSVSGGSAFEIEEDVWLLSVQEDSVRIQLANR